MSYTPGLWEVNTVAGKPYREVFSGDVLVCDCGATNVEMEPEEIEANARLISAAPDLLKALKRILPAAADSKHRDFSDLAGNEDTLREMLTAAVAAIAKAEAPPTNTTPAEPVKEKTMERQEQRSGCPHCGACLSGDPIPREQQAMFGGHTHYDRTIGIVDPAKDRVVEWQCPDCGERWPR